MSLSSYIDTVISNLDADLNNPDGDNWKVELLKGELEKAERRPPPSVVFLPNGDGAQDGFAPPKQSAANPSRSLYTIEAQLQVRIWGVGRTMGAAVFDDFGTCEYIRERVLVAMRQTAGGVVFRPRGGGFEPERSGARGRIYVLNAQVELPVLEGATVFTQANQFTNALSENTPSETVVITQP